MGRYFGTDGIRGVVGTDLTADFALRVGYAAGKALRRNFRGRKLPYFDRIDKSLPHPCVLLARDTRLSSPMLADAVSNGLSAAGVHVADLGVVPTPLVGLMANRFNAIGGVMVTASHNPVDYNGIKVFRSDGLKVDSATLGAIEELIDAGSPVRQSSTAGTVTKLEVSRLYVDYLRRMNGARGQGAKIALDLAHGAACGVAAEVFASFGFTVVPVCAEPDGSRINVRCGATDLRRLREEVLEAEADWGFAFDGDADRVQAVDARGRSVDGDKLMALLALLHEPYRRDGRLVFTQMTNRGVERYLRENGIRTYRTAVGDSAVLRAMRRHQIRIGGEQSGHIICWDQTCGGDGILVSLFVSELLTRHGLSLGDFAERIPTYPQVLQNVPLADHQGWQRDERFHGRLQRLQAAYEPEVRFCVRPSGTESLVRIMTEASKLALARRANAEVAELFAAYRRK